MKQKLSLFKANYSNPYFFSDYTPFNSLSESSYFSDFITSETSLVTRSSAIPEYQNNSDYSSSLDYSDLPSINKSSFLSDNSESESSLYSNSFLNSESNTYYTSDTLSNFILSDY